MSKRNMIVINRARYEAAVKHMNVPAERQRGCYSNALWFLRNGAMINHRHPKCSDAVQAAQKLTRFM